LSVLQGRQVPSCCCVPAVVFFACCAAEVRGIRSLTHQGGGGCPIAASQYLRASVSPAAMGRQFTTQFRLITRHSAPNKPPSTRSDISSFARSP
jgi:hypothetical protein